MGKTVHICVEGTDEKRIIASMRRYGMDTLFVLLDRNHDRLSLSSLNRWIKPSVIRVNMKDSDDIFAELVKVIRDHDDPDDKIYINLSGAPELVMAAMISAVYSMPQRKNVKLIMKTEEDRAQKSSRYDREYNMSGQRDYSFMTHQLPSTEHIEIPVLPIEDLADKDKDVLRFLYKHKEVDSIKELLRYVDISRSTFQYRLEKLKELGLVETREHRQRVGLKLTRAGELYVKAHIKKV